MRRAPFLAAVATQVVACADPPHEGEPRRGRGWDLNSGNWNGNMGTWGTIAGIGGNPPWAPDGTGTGTLTNQSVMGLRWTPPQPTGACGALTPGVDRVRFLSSTRVDGTATGPDVELDRAGVLARMSMGERVAFHAEALDGTLASIHVTVRLRRVDTLSHEVAPSNLWPVFELEVCEHARPDRGFAHLGYVSWAPMVVLPETPGGAFQFPPDIVQPVTTLPRAEYRDNPAVPSVVATQTGALMFKFAFYAALPVALGDDPDLAFTTSRGATISNNQVLIRGAIALGNGGWVTMPADGGQHQFLTFFTRTGTAASMFAVGRGDGSGPAELKLPASWDRGTITALQLTAAELLPRADDALDAVHAYQQGPLNPGDVWAQGPTEVGHGTSSQRYGYYLGGSGNNNRMVFFAQRQASGQRARWAGIINGPIQSQRQLAQLMMLPSPGPTMVVAAESPPPEGKPAFESPHLEPMPEDSPVFAMPPEADAAEIDAPGPDAAVIDAAVIDAAAIDAMVDAMVDAATDAAQVIDAGADAFMGSDSGVPVDAADDAFVPPDSSLPVDAGADALIPPDSSLPVDAGVDAPVMPPDANNNPACKAPGCPDAQI